MPEIPTFDHIPKLRELLPNGGLPGVEYAQITAARLAQAYEVGWSKLNKTKPYRVSGPDGVVDCELYGRGKPIQGQSTNSGRRVCHIDDAMYDITGLPRPTGESKVKVTQPDKPSEDVTPIVKTRTTKEGG